MKEKLLFKAIKYNNLLLTKFALRLGADIEAKEGGYTALHLAASKGYVDNVKLLLKNGANIENTDCREKRTVLHLASFEGHYDVVKLLIENDANIEAKDLWSDTPLHKASSKGHDKVVEILLQNKSDIEAKDHLNRTPIFNAIKYNRIKVLKLLLSKGANVEVQNNEDDGTLVYSAASRYNTEALKLLVLYGGEISEANKNFILNYYPKSTLEELEKIVPLKARKSASTLCNQMIEFSKIGLPAEINSHLASYLPGNDSLTFGTIQNTSLAATCFVQYRYNNLSYAEQVGRTISNYIPKRLYNALPSCITNTIKAAPKLSLKDSFNNRNQIERNKEMLYR